MLSYLVKSYDYTRVGVIPRSCMHTIFQTPTVSTGQVSCHPPAAVHGKCGWMMNGMVNEQQYQRDGKSTGWLLTLVNPTAQGQVSAHFREGPLIAQL